MYYLYHVWVCVNVPLDRGKVLRLTAQRLSFRDTLVRERQLPCVHLKVRVKLDRADELAKHMDMQRTQHWHSDTHSGGTTAIERTY